MARKPVRREDGRIVGVVTDGTYTTKRDPEKHFHVVHNGWGIDRAVLDDLREQGVHTVRVETPDLAYAASVEAFWRFGKAIHVPGFGRQMILPLRRWRTEAPGLAQGTML